MAIIYSYPTKTNLVLADTILLNDSEDDNKTKTTSLQELANVIDDTVTLQEVLDTGSTATSSLGGWAGVMSLSKSGAPAINVILDVNAASGTGGNAAIYTTSNAEIGGNLKVTSNATIKGDLSMELATSDIVMNDGSITADAGTDLNFVVTTEEQAYDFRPASPNIDFKVGITDNRIRHANWELDGNFDLNALGNVVFSSNTQTIESSGLAIFASTGGDTIIGADDTLYIGQTTGTYEPKDIVVHASESITLSTDTATTNFKLNGSIPQIESNSPHYFDNEIRLDGSSAGTDGQVMISKGVGNNPKWVDTSTFSVENLIEEVENNTGILIAKGTPIFIAANPAGTPRVAPADASIASQMPASGLAVDDIPNGVGSPGQMIISGQLESVNTNAFAVGDTVYVGAGGGLAGKPNGATEGIQNVGIVTKKAGSGSIQVTAVGRINDLPNNDANALFSADANGHPVSTTGVIDVDVANQLTTISQKYEIKGLSPYGTNNNIIGSESGSLIGGTGTANANVYIGKLAAGAAGAANPNSDNSSFNVAIGNQTLAGNNVTATSPLKNTSSKNIAIGHQALSQPGGPTAPTTASLGESNIAIGYQTAVGLYNSGVLTEGSHNTFVGNQSGFDAKEAYKNVGIGSSALTSLLRGYNNVAIGAGVNPTGGTIINAEGNTIIGTSADTITTTTNFGTAIGGQATTDQRGTALGFNSTAQQNCVALGSESVAAGGQSVFNINVAGVVNPAQGGLPSFPDRAAAVATLNNGDVYVLTPGGPDNPGTSFVLAIV